MKVKISHLKHGFHTIELAEKPASFDLADSQIFRSEISVVLEIDKEKDTLYIKQHASTTGDFICDRCAEAFRREVMSHESIVFTSDRDLIQYDDELRYLAPDEQEIDITDDVRDALMLAIPFKLLCTDECKGICPHCGANLNVSSCECTTDFIDPRWEALRQLK